MQSPYLGTALSRFIVENLCLLYLKDIRVKCILLLVKGVKFTTRYRNYALLPIRVLMIESVALSSKLCINIWNVGISSKNICTSHKEQAASFRDGSEIIWKLRKQQTLNIYKHKRVLKSALYFRTMREKCYSSVFKKGKDIKNITGICKCTRRYI